MAGSRDLRMTHLDSSLEKPHHLFLFPFLHLLSDLIWCLLLYICALQAVAGGVNLEVTHFDFGVLG